MCFEVEGLTGLIPGEQGGPEQASRGRCRRRPGSFRGDWRRIDPCRRRFSRLPVTHEGRWRNYRSGLRVFFGLELAREVESQLAEPPAQGIAGNPQPAGGLMLIPTRVFQDAGEQEAVDLAVGLRI